MTTRWLDATGDCDARTQGASIAALLARPRTTQRAAQRGPDGPCFFVLGALTANPQTRTLGAVTVLPFEPGAAGAGVVAAAGGILGRVEGHDLGRGAVPP